VNGAGGDAPSETGARPPVVAVPSQATDVGNSPFVPLDPGVTLEDRSFTGGPAGIP
jgi:hypothetical protein